MGWNYRIVRKKISFVHDGMDMYEYTYNIHEAYVDANDKVGSITVEPVNVFGTTIEELHQVYKMMKDAFTKPILDVDQIPEKGYKSKKSKSSKKTFPYNPRAYTKVDMADIIKQMELDRVRTETAYNKKIKKKSKYEL